MRLYREQVLFAFSLLAAVASAARIDLSDAECAARAFAAEGRHLAIGLGSLPREAREHSAADGTAFFSVRMTGGGTVFLSGDDRHEPVIAFSSMDIDYDSLDPASPLHALLNGDQRLRRVSAEAAEKWERLLESGDSLPAYPSLLSVVAQASGLTTPGDIRVPALVETKWNQKKAGGRNCYNLHTPGNVYCGCVATAMSQVMRYHRWPDAAHPVAAETFPCTYNGSATNLTMQGGVYDWSLMALGTSTDPIDTDEECAAIGKLTSDAGIAVKMGYSSSGSGTYSTYVADAFMDTWHYGQATYLYDYADWDYGYIDGEYGAESRLRTLRQALFSNFDCGHPVMLGIGNSGNEGHSVVADGYGYDGGTDYVHLNMGWSGSDDLWYNLPSIGTGYSFNSVSEVVYNIFPTNDAACAAFSGRVLDASGNGVAAARVTIRRNDTSEVVAEISSTDSGVYGAVLPGGASYDVVAVSSDMTKTGAVSCVALASPAVEEWRKDDELITNRLVFPDGTIGNSWGNDIVLGIEIEKRTAPTNFYVSASSGIDAPGRGTSAAPYATIQYAITNGQYLVAGDTINVLPGTYYGCVETPSTAISIVSTDGPERTVIDGLAEDCCYYGGANLQNLIAGFSLTNGAYYGGVYEGTVSNCVISGCESCDYRFGYGGGAYNARLYECVLYDNGAIDGGGADTCTLVDCLIFNNCAFNGGGAENSIMTNCLVARNYAVQGFFFRSGNGGGVCECDIVNCTVAGNVAFRYGGGAYLHECGEARNSIVCGNTSTSGSAYGNDVYGNHYWTMSNSLSDVDAKYRDADNGDYGITPSSPALDAGSPDFVAIDHDLLGTNRVWGKTVDIGCFEYHLPPSVADPMEIGGVAAALKIEGYDDGYAEAVAEPKDYAYLVEWTSDHGLTPSDLNNSPTGFVSPGLNADELVELDPTNLVLQSFTPSTDGVWSVALSLPGYDRSRINVPLLKAAIGIVGSETLVGEYSSDGLELAVSPTPTNITVRVTPPPMATNYFMRATVR